MDTQPEHLTVARSDRGFVSLPTIPSEYGGEVSARESSAADGPHVWLEIECPQDLNRPNGPSAQAIAHLTTDNAWRVADQLRHLVRNHYQGDATPDWAGEPAGGDSFARSVLQLIAEQGCQNYGGGECRSAQVRLESGGYGPLRPDAEYSAERWCDPCVARAGLRGAF